MGEGSEALLRWTTTGAVVLAEFMRYNVLASRSMGMEGLCVQEDEHGNEIAAGGRGLRLCGNDV